MPRMPVPPASRRAFLRLAALAPLAAAGCASLRAGPAREPAPGPAPAPPADPLASFRAVPLPTSVEPALVFRALGGRGRCG
jgi:hypothetical protein